MEEIRAQLVNEKDVTNKMIIEGYLIGVIDHNGYPIVNVIKNRVNSVTGKVPLNIWTSLVEDLEEVKQKAIRKAYEMADEQEAEQEAYNEIFGDVSELFEVIGRDFDTIFGKVKPKVKEVVEDVAEKTESTIINFLKDLEKAAQDIRPRVQEVKDTLQSEGIKAGRKIQLQIDKVKLQKLQEDADEMGVSTKGFSKKIRNKIQVIDSLLGK